jgi:hypothetical protein
MGLQDRDYMRVIPGGRGTGDPGAWPENPPPRRKTIVAVMAVILLLIFVFAFVF